MLMPLLGGSEAHRGRALVLVAGAASAVGGVRPQHLYIVVGFIWLSFVSPGPPREEDFAIREDAPHRYEFAAMLCFLLFAHNLLERIEGAGD
jgi:hypothetical protein